MIQLPKNGKNASKIFHGTTGFLLAVISEAFNNPGKKVEFFERFTPTPDNSLHYRNWLGAALNYRIEQLALTGFTVDIPAMLVWMKRRTWRDDLDDIHKKAIAALHIQKRLPFPKTPTSFM